MRVKGRGEGGRAIHKKESAVRELARSRLSDNQEEGGTGRGEGGGGMVEGRQTDLYMERMREEADLDRDVARVSGLHTAGHAPRSSG